MMRCALHGADRTARMMLCAASKIWRLNRSTSVERYGLAAATRTSLFISGDSVRVKCSAVLRK